MIRRTLRSLTVVCAAFLVMDAAPTLAQAPEEPVAVATSAPKIVEFTEVRRPPVAFVEEGEYVGINAERVAELGIKDGDPILLKAGDGPIVGVHTKIVEVKNGTIWIKESIRNTLKVTDGPVKVMATNLAWPTGTPTPTEVTITKVTKPTQDFVSLGDACGISYTLFRELNCAPGAKARLRTASGEKVVTLRLLDRGPDTIAIKGSIRKALGIEEGSTPSVSLRVIAPAPSTAPADNPAAESEGDTAE